jgi:hypothetical protein
VRDNWTVLSCAIAVSDSVTGVIVVFEERNLIVYINQDIMGMYSWRKRDFPFISREVF